MLHTSGERIICRHLPQLIYPYIDFRGTAPFSEAASRVPKEQWCFNVNFSSGHSS